MWQAYKPWIDHHLNMSNVQQFTSYQTPPECGYLSMPIKHRLGHGLLVGLRHYHHPHWPKNVKTSIRRTQQGTRHPGLGIAPNRAFHIHCVAIARVPITNAADLLQRASGKSKGNEQKQPWGFNQEPQMRAILNLLHHLWLGRVSLGKVEDGGRIPMTMGQALGQRFEKLPKGPPAF